MSKKTATASERRHMGAVAELGCVLCAELGQPGVSAEVHHVREGQGMSQRASNWLTVPLCPSCHRGSKGLHGDRTMLRIANVDEMGLLALTIEAMSKRAEA